GGSLLVEDHGRGGRNPALQRTQRETECVRARECSHHRRLERQAAPWYWSTGRGRQVESGRSRGRRRVGGLPVRRGNLRLVEPLRRDRRRTRLARYLPGRDLTGFGRGLMSADLPGQ